MLESLQSVLQLVNPPSQANVGEAYMLHQSLAAYYYLLVKCRLYEGRCETSELREWLSEVIRIIDARIDQLVAVMNRLGIPLPPTLPSTGELTDQFMGLDCAAMLKGMVTTDALGLQASRQPDVALLFSKMLSGTILAGAKLLPIVERQGWAMWAPTYPGAPTISRE